MQRLEVSGAVRPIYGSLGVKRLTNLMHIISFYNKFIIRLYMFRALCAHHQEVRRCTVSKTSKYQLIGHAMGLVYLSIPVNVLVLVKL